MELTTQIAEGQKSLSEAIKNLTEAVTARFSSATPTTVEKEKDALVETVRGMQARLDALEKVKTARKMAWATPGMKSEEGVEVHGFGRFLKAVANKDEKFLSEMKAANGQNEGTNADGGFLVPVEYANEIIKLQRQSSIVRNIARLFPMGTLSRKVPRELTKPSVSWVAEATEPSLTKGTVEQITQTAKKLIAVIPFTDELLEDNNVSYDQFIFQVVAEEMGREEDKIALVGDVSGVSDPFNGVYFTSGVNSVSMNGANLSYDDIVDVMFALQAPYRANGVFVLSSTVLKKLMKLKDDNNQPLWSRPVESAPGTILGKPYYETDQIPSTLGATRTGGSNSALLFGDFGRGLWISDRGGYTVKGSDSAATTSKSAFMQDETWFKFRRRMDITVANPEAFAKMAVA